MLREWGAYGTEWVSLVLRTADVDKGIFSVYLYILEHVNVQLVIREYWVKKSYNRREAERGQTDIISSL